MNNQRLGLTHEQADFDAVASLLGIYILEPDIITVLPHKINRNVRSFLTLYGTELPFIETQDLSSSIIAETILVDTQSLITLKGFTSKTIVKAFDHHPIRQGIPDNWKITATETGATTSYFVELIADRQESLSVIQATLLLLGIYEDTGSLTYSSTTGRDGRAAGYLIDQGANLQIATNFLNPPLSVDQMKLFDQLIANMETLTTKGHLIVISKGDQGDSIEEVSTLAHKIRDLWDPDALFLIVKTIEGIRLVARSSSDQVDVSLIATSFGGGGHKRAAAALIRSETEKDTQCMIEEVHQKLIELLNKVIIPTTTVQQIMSKSPHMITPDISLEEISHLMQLYGYEGFPVIENGKVIGLITRRVVDRAISHKISISLKNLMEIGEIWVYPDDSIQHLQGKMTESGWGQIPVISRETNEIIGIVTRTDLLKILTVKTSKKNRKNYGSKLISAMPEDTVSLLRVIADVSSERKMPIYLVGGFVRDLIVDRPSMDFDIVVEGDAIQLCNQILKKYGGRIVEHHRFGTAKWFLKDSEFHSQLQPECIDFISARMEFYSHPSALPVVERSSIKYDLQRRDFTINTLALRLDGKYFGELYDYWGGFNDLENKKIRILHSLSFIDDPTRILRAIRFEKRFNFEIENRTFNLMMEAKELLNDLSGDRIRHELDLIISEKECISMLSRLSDLGILFSIHPSILWNEVIQLELKDFCEKFIPQDLDKFIPSKYLTNFGLMFYLFWFSESSLVDLNSICNRLNFPGGEKKILLQINKILDFLPKMKNSRPSLLSKKMDDYSEIALYIASLKLGTEFYEIILKYFNNWRKVHPFTSGNDLKKLGLRPGKQYQNILSELRDAWLDGSIKNREEEMRLLSKLTKNV